MIGLLFSLFRCDNADDVKGGGEMHISLPGQIFPLKMGKCIHVHFFGSRYNKGIESHSII